MKLKQALIKIWAVYTIASLSIVLLSFFEFTVYLLSSGMGEYDFSWKVFFLIHIGVVAAGFMLAGCFYFMRQHSDG